MSDPAGKTEDPPVDDDATPLPRTWPRRLLRGTLIVIYAAVFTILIGAIIGFSLEFAEISPAHIEYPVSPEIFAIVFLIVCVFNGYLLGAYMIRRRPRLTFWATVIVIVTPFVVWGVWCGYGEYRLSRAIAAWEEVGGWIDERPTRTARLRPGENAADAYRGMGPLLDAVPDIYFDTETQRLVRDDGWDRSTGDSIETPVSIEQYRVILAQHRTLFDAIRAAAEREHCDWGPDPLDWLGRHEAFVASRWIEEIAGVHMRAGEYKEAGVCLLTRMAIARQTSVDANYQALLWSFRDVVTDMQELRLLPMDDSIPWAKFDQELAQWNPASLLQRAILIEASSRMVAYHDRPYGMIPDDYVIAHEFGLLDEDVAFYLQNARAWYDAAGAKAVAVNAGPQIPGARWYRPLSKRWGLVDTNAIGWRDEVDYACRRTRTAIAVIRFRLEHDRFPEDLDELPKLFLDPMTNVPFTYRHWDVGFEVSGGSAPLYNWHPVWGEPDPNSSTSDTEVGSGE